MAACSKPDDSLLRQIWFIPTQTETREKKAPIVRGFEAHGPNRSLDSAVEVARKLVTASDMDLDLRPFLVRPLPTSRSFVPLDGLRPSTPPKGTTAAEECRIVSWDRPIADRAELLEDRSGLVIHRVSVERSGNSP